MRFLRRPEPATSLTNNESLSPGLILAQAITGENLSSLGTPRPLSEDGCKQAAERGSSSGSRSNNGALETPHAAHDSGLQSRHLYAHTAPQRQMPQLIRCRRCLVEREEEEYRRLGSGKPVVTCEGCRKAARCLNRKPAVSIPATIQSGHC